MMPVKVDMWKCYVCEKLYNTKDSAGECCLGDSSSNNATFKFKVGDRVRCVFLCDRFGQKATGYVVAEKEVTYPPEIHYVVALEDMYNSVLKYQICEEDLVAIDSTKDPGK